jgi:hypothetical protein
VDSDQSEFLKLVRSKFSKSDKIQSKFGQNRQNLIKTGGHLQIFYDIETCYPLPSSCSAKCLPGRLGQATGSSDARSGRCQVGQRCTQGHGQVALVRQNEPFPLGQRPNGLRDFSNRWPRHLLLPPPPSAFIICSSRHDHAMPGPSLKSSRNWQGAAQARPSRRCFPENVMASMATYPKDFFSFSYAYLKFQSTISDPMTTALFCLTAGR